MYDLSLVIGIATTTFAIGAVGGWLLSGFSFRQIKAAFCDHERLLLQQIQVQFGELERMSKIALRAQRELVEHKRAKN